MPENFRALRGFDQTHSDNVETGAEVTLLSMKISTKTNLRLTHFGNIVTPNSEWGYMEWSVRINGVPDETLGKVLDQLGTIGLPRELGRKTIVHGGDLLEIVAISTSAIACRAGVTLKGEYGRSL